MAQDALLQDDEVRELEGHRADKTTFPINFELSDMPIGERRMFVVFVRDITTRKRHERMKDDPRALPSRLRR